MEWIMNLEGFLLLWIQEHIRQDFMTPFWKGITFLGDEGWFWILTAVILLVFKKTRRCGFTVLLALGIGALITNVCLKNMVMRIRPYEVVEGLTYLIEKPSDFSFPSGHTCASFAAAVSLWKCFPEPHKKAVGAGAMLLAVLIACSRLYLGVHYPTDILGGILFGVAAAMLSCLLVNKMQERKS